MPLLPSSADVLTGRRSLLARAVGSLGAVCGVGGLGAASGCSAGADGGGASGSDGERTPEERQLRAAAARRSRALLRRYDGTAEVHGGLAETLKPLRAAVAKHAEALAGEHGSGGSGGSGRSGGSGGSSGAGGSGGSDGAGAKDRGGHAKVAVPEKEKDALEALADAERRTARAHTAALSGAPPELAVLLASVAAAGSVHAYLLARGGEVPEKPEGDDS